MEDIIKEGKKFIIKDEDSVVFKHQCVTKRVPIQGSGREVMVQMDEQFKNIAPDSAAFKNITYLCIV